MTTTTFISKGKKLYGEIRVPTGGKAKHPAVIYSHAFGVNCSYNTGDADWLVDNGFAVVQFDFSGGSSFSRSEGSTLEMSLFTEAADLEAVMDQVKLLDFIDRENLFLAGESQGAAVSVITGARRQDEVKGMVLYYPPLMIPDNSRNEYPDRDLIPQVFNIMGTDLGRRYYDDVYDFDIYDSVAAFKKPVLIFHGTRDSIVPLDFSRKAEKTFPDGELMVVQGGGHGFQEQNMKKVREKELAFLNSLLINS